MPEHQLPEGKEIIARIVRLGGSLGFHAKQEHRVLKATAAANDVAWFADDEHDVPVMVFEVESSASSSAAHNVTKTFGSAPGSNPLFLFHIFLKSNASSPRVSELVRFFGSFNYGAYCLPEENQRFFEDILAQKRRLSSRLNLISLFDNFVGEDWQGLNLSRLIRRTLTLGFERSSGEIAPSLAILGLSHKVFLSEFLRFIDCRESPRADDPDDDAYETYWAAEFRWLVEYALLCGNGRRTKRTARWSQLTTAINRSWRSSRLIDHLGQSEETDRAIIDAHAAIWSLFSILTVEIPGASRYWCSQCWRIIRVTKNHEFFWIFSSAWLIHITASSPHLEPTYERIRAFVNKRGGLPRRVLYQPKGHGIGFELEAGDGWWHRQLARPRVKVPKRSTFLSRLNRRPRTRSQYHRKSCRLAIRFLLHETTLMTWGPTLRNLLQTSAQFNDAP